MACPHDELKCAPLAVLAHRINQYQETLDGYTRNRLRVALDQGEVLALLKQRVGNRKWKAYREENCPKVAERTDVLHRRLVAHRLRIERELTSNPDLGVVEAAKLISTPKPKVSNKAGVPDQKVPESTMPSKTPVTTEPATPSIVISPCVPAAPLGNADRETIFALAQRALHEARRPVSAPNNERVQELLQSIIDEVKTAKQPAKPPVLDTTAFTKAMGLAA